MFSIVKNRIKHNKFSLVFFILCVISFFIIPKVHPEFAARHLTSIILTEQGLIFFHKTINGLLIISGLGSIVFLFALIFSTEYKFKKKLSQLEDRTDSQLSSIENWISADIAVIGIIVVLGVLIRLYFGLLKGYFHIDEILSIDLISGIRRNSTILLTGEDRILSGEYFKKLLDLSKSEMLNTKAFIEVVNLDPHPPLYYWFLRYFQILFTQGEFSYWPSTILNLLFYLCTNFFLIKLGKLYFTNKIYVFFPIVAFAFTPVAISMALFMRMYEMLSMVTVGSLFFYTKTFFINGFNYKYNRYLIIWISISLLTQYFFLIYLFFTVCILFVYFILTKKLKSAKEIIKGTLLSFGITLVINPFFAPNLLFTKRGAEATQVVGHFKDFFITIGSVFRILNETSLYFGWMLAIVCVIIIFKFFRRKMKMDINFVSSGLFLLSILLSTIVICKVAPYTTMRYYYYLIIPSFLILFVFMQNVFVRSGKIISVLYLTLSIVFLITPSKVELGSESLFYSIYTKDNHWKRVISSQTDTVVLVVDEKQPDWQIDFLLPMLINKNEVVLLYPRISLNEDIKEFLDKKSSYYLFLPRNNTVDAYQKLEKILMDTEITKEQLELGYSDLYFIKTARL